VPLVLLLVVVVLLSALCVATTKAARLGAATRKSGAHSKQSAKAAPADTSPADILHPSTSRRLT
jgi:hypothetical protein